MLVLVEGRLIPDKVTGGPKIWTRQDGSAGASFEVTAATVKFLSSRGEGGEHPESQIGEEEQAAQAGAPEDDIPF
jgi:single-strand DNA-binding protein